MHTVTQFPHRISETPDMGIPMPDGCRLSARVWMPEDAGANPVPAVLEYIPYRKRDGTAPRDEVMHRWFAGRGYAAIRIDMRGNGDSEGLMADEYTATELRDACDAIAWIAAQPWCDGNVGMMGKSWGGFNCLQVAALAPPALKAIITVCSTVDRFADDIHFKGGCLLNDNLAWSAVMLAFSSRPPDPALVGDRWRGIWLERLENEPFLAPLWASHQARDAYWRHGSVCEDYSALKVPVLSIGGWADNYMNTVAHLVENLDVPAKGIVGPWVHQYPHQATPEPRIGFLQEALRWWDRWLRGLPNGAEDDPAYRVWRQNSARPARMRQRRDGVWLAETALPSTRVRPEVLALSPGGVLGGAGGLLDARVNSPLDCGFGTGRYFPMSADRPEMPGDQRGDDARSLCFEMEVDAPLDIVGAPLLRLRLSSDKPLAQLVARLSEVHPDGASNRITYGVLNLCHRNDPGAPEPMVPGRAVEVTLRLDQIAHRVMPGMRLRLALSNAFWPFLWPSPERTTLSIESGELELPIHSGDVSADEWRFDEAEGAETVPRRELRPPSYEKTLTEDWVSGEITLTLTDDSGLFEDGDHGLITGAVVREKWVIRPDDPLSARGECHHSQELARGDWSVRTETFSAMRSDRENLYLNARIEAWEGDERVFERDFAQTVPRRFV